MKTSNLVVPKKHEKLKKFAKFAMGATFLSLVAVMSCAIPVHAAVVDEIVNEVVGILETASFFIGIIIVLWGAFQIILALRREDSEGISKQITTIVVGCVLVGFGTFATSLIDILQSSR